MERSVAALILTHGRPDNVITLKTLRAAGYTGRIVFVVDNEDRTVDRYRANFGADSVVVFDKKAWADRIDEANNFDDRRVIVHARNASFAIARDLGFTHFVQLDDDYREFKYRQGRGRFIDGGSKPIRRMDAILDALCDFLDETDALTIALSQGGDHIGGFSGPKLKRKAMNSFVCRVDRPFTFLGSINEDVNTYTYRGSRGDLFFTFTGLQLDQEATQSQAGGMTGIYLQRGTYLKSFSTVLFCPSSVRVAMMSTKFSRMHHNIAWAKTVPSIVPALARHAETPGSPRPAPEPRDCGPRVVGVEVALVEQAAVVEAPSIVSPAERRPLVAMSTTPAIETRIVAPVEIIDRDPRCACGHLASRHGERRLADGIAAWCYSCERPCPEDAPLLCLDCDEDERKRVVEHGRCQGCFDAALDAEVVRQEIIQEEGPSWYRSSR